MFAVAVPLAAVVAAINNKFEYTSDLEKLLHSKRGMPEERCDTL